MRAWIGGLVVAAGATAASGLQAAVPTAYSVPFGSHGDAVDDTSGQPVALTPTSLLVAAEGPDGQAGTADDETLLVTGLDTTPVVTPLATKHGPTAASRIERLSATRAVRISAGDDGAFGTADDAVRVLDRLGSGNLVKPVVVGGLGDSQQYTPERLASDSFVLPSLGADLAADTADDEVLVVSVATDTPTVKRFAAPFQRSGGRSRMIASSPDAFFIASDGPDKKSSGADDLVYLFRRSGASFARTDLAAPGLNRRSAGRSVRLSSTHALVVSAGPDFLDSTSDDEVLLLDAAAGTVTHITVPFAKNGAAGQPTALAPGLAVVATMGSDGVEGTSDDAVAILSGLGTTNSVSVVVVGATNDNNECRPVRLDSTTFALVTFGADRTVSTFDDAITIVHGVDKTPLVQHVVVGAVAGGSTSAVVPISTSALLVAGGGADQAVGTSDDAVVVLTGIGSALAINRLQLGGALDSIDAFRFVATVLGGGRAALLSSGADDHLGAGSDDAVRVLDGLGTGSSLVVNRLQAQFANPKPKRASRLTVNAKLTLEDPTALLSEDLTLSVGNASQTLPAGSLTSTNRGRALRYSDPQGARGIVRAFSFNTVTGALTFDVRGADLDVAATSPGYVPVAIEVGSTLVPASVAAKGGRKGFTYRKRGK